MRLNIIKYILTLATILVSSCASTKYIQLDVMQPAAISFPKEIVNVALVDNAGTTLKDSIQREKNIVLTSQTKEVFMESLSQFLAEENYFTDVKTFPRPIRTDIRYGMQVPLSTANISQIAEQMEVDGVIILDAFEIIPGETMADFGETYYRASTAKMSILFRTYNATGTLLAPAMATEDSITWVTEQGIKFDEAAYKQLALKMSEGMVYQLVPHWDQQERWYYTDGTKRMKDAEKHLKINNWTEAAKSWGAAFELVKDDKAKARIANNIALANEHLDDIQNAITWINIATELIANYKRDEYYNYISWYNFTLNKRFKNMPKVLEQIGAEDIEEVVTVEEEILEEN